MAPQTEIHFERQHTEKEPLSNRVVELTPMWLPVIILIVASTLFIYGQSVSDARALRLNYHQVEATVIDTQRQCRIEYAGLWSVIFRRCEIPLNLSRYSQNCDAAGFFLTSRSCNIRAHETWVTRLTYNVASRVDSYSPILRTETNRITIMKDGFATRYTPIHPGAILQLYVSNADPLQIRPRYRIDLSE